MTFSEQGQSATKSELTLRSFLTSRGLPDNIIVDDWDSASINLDYFLPIEVNLRHRGRKRGAHKRRIIAAVKAWCKQEGRILEDVEHILVNRIRFIVWH